MAVLGAGMVEEDFQEAVALAQHIEQNALGHAEFSGSLEVTRVIDFSPERYSGMSFDELRVQQERVEKVIRASRLNIYSAPREIIAPELRKQGEEVESKVKEITTETLHRTEEMKLEMEKELKVPEQVQPAFVFEKPEEYVVESPKPEAKGKKPEFEPDISALSFEKEEKEEALAPKPPEIRKPELLEAKPKVPETAAPPLVRPPAPLVKPPIPLAKPPAATVPPVLAREEPAPSTFDKIQQSFDAEWGGEKDDAKIRRKMLELTKDLFREKSSSRREELKQQIVVLKNMLMQPAAKEKPKEVAKEDFAYASGLFATLTNTLSVEFASAVNRVSHDAEEQIAAAKKAYTEATIDLTDADADARKAAFDKYMFELTKVSEETKATVATLKPTLIQKHRGSLEQFIASLDKKDEVNLARAEEKEASLQQAYAAELSALVSSIERKTTSLIDAASHAALPSSGALTPAEVKVEKKAGMPKANMDAIIAEVNSTDEGTLLYHLHAKDLAYYKDFERGRISKQQALARSRMLLAKEKGLNDSIVKKNWGEG